MLQSIQKKVNTGLVINRDEAQWLYLYAQEEDLSTLATQVKSRFHPPFDASYLIMAIVNYTNVCVAACDYCSFYRLPHEKEAYLKSFDEVCEKVEKLRSFGGTLAGFNGGFHPKLKIQDYADLFHNLHLKFPDMTFYEMTVAEFMFSCKVSKITYKSGAQILKAAGTEWVTGGGAEVLDDAFRKRHSPGKYTVDDYFKAQAALLETGIGSTATMVIGFDETLDERLNHLERLRSFQESQTNKLTSFLCWTYKPYANKFGGKEISQKEYLRWLAVCRIYLYNFAHIRTSVLTQNEGALLGLKYGANDFDIPIEDEVTQKAGAVITLNFDSLLQTARNEGFNVRNRLPFKPYNISNLPFSSERISQ